MRALYISHNGMLENLGQAQVLPYVRGLSRRGVQFHLVSFELPTASDTAIESLRDSLRADGIGWTALRRARDPRLRTKVFESLRGVAHALGAGLSRPPDIVHGRSYIPTAIADLVASTVPRAKLLFDCRGMLGDEYVDAGYWTSDRLEYRLIKRYEQRAFRRADGVVVLTDALRRIVCDRGWVDSPSRVTTIPCCVDLTRFRFDAAERQRLRRDLGLEDRLVLVYSGSLGGWYQEAELARFAALVRRRASEPVSFLLLTHHDTKQLRKHLAEDGFPTDSIVERAVPPEQMFKYLSVGDLALSFIKSCFSKIGSSPTKVAEYLACGLPTVLNGDIGDQADLRSERDACVVLESLREQDLEGAVEPALALARRSLADRAAACRDVATARFGLEEVGVERYWKLYQAIATGSVPRTEDWRTAS